MAKIVAFILRITQAQNQGLKKLSLKKGINRTNLVRIAIADLLEREGITSPTDQY